MTALLIGSLAIALSASPLDEGAATELRYSGTLTKLARDADGQAVKGFNLYCLVLPANGVSRPVAYLVNERGGGAWPWPERFGQLNFNAEHQPVGSVQPRLLYDHEGTPHVLSLPRPVYAPAKPLQGGATWKVDNETYEVKQAAKVQNRDCWQIEVSNNLGRKRTLWIDKSAPLLVSLEERVFMGQGVEFALAMKLDSLQTLDEAELARLRKPLDGLLQLQADLKRGENEQKPELTEAQLAVAGEALAKIEKVSEETPFGLLVGIASRDVKLQNQRSDDVEQLAKQFVGQPAPPFSLPLLETKQTVEPKDREGKITVLHFWDYHGEPLSEPYGQVGYLDFLSGRRRKLGVQVYGVAVDSRFAEKDKSSVAVRSVNKLRSFMNLAYPIATDSGELLAKFGDPRKLGAKLPLWVVIGPDGKVAHYHSGFYKINPDEGLRALDDVLVKLIQDQREKTGEK